MKSVMIAATALALTAPLLVACNGNRSCDSAPAPQDGRYSVSPADASDTGEAALQQAAAPDRTSGGRGGGGYRGSSSGGGGDDCDDD